ncbi:MAG TPA: PAS domain-containing protein [Chryseosolibacter sp.]
MERALISSVREKVDLQFIHFPSYARYLVHHELDDFVKQLIALYEESDIPVLRFFKSMDTNQRDALVMAGTREMLTLIASNKADQYIDKTISTWLNNQVPEVSREQIHSQDITLVNYARRSTLRQFLPRYTDDVSLWLQVAGEIDRFFVALDSELHASYLELQQKTINSMNEALEKREQQLLEAQEIGLIGSFEWDLTGTASSYTSQVFKIFEMEKASNLAAFLDYVHPDDREKVKGALQKAFADGDYECEYRYCRNGKDKIIFSRGKVQFLDGKPVRMIGTVTDVTEHHKIIRRLQESEKLHKQAQALTHIGNWSWLIAENAVSWSDELYRIYGLAPQSEEITFERFLSFVHPDERERRMAEIRKSLETLQMPEYHMRIIAADGVAKVLRGKGEVVADQNGKPVALLGTCQDVTREFTLTSQLREREKYLQQLNQSLQFANLELSRTNEELESFNFIASHDLQEPLRKIQIYSNRIIENGFMKLPAPLQEYFEKINNASNRMQALIEDFLRFSQTFDSRQVAEQVDLNVIVDEIKTELSTRIEEKHAMVETGNLPTIWAVPFQIKQLMTNLLTNALKYTHDGVTPHIAITSSIVKGSDIGLDQVIPELFYTKVSVADNGIGFETKYAAKIFELFQRLHNKNVYSGTGIGLALCKKIVQHMNGFITAESQVGKGSVFTFYLPIQG